MKSEGSEIFTDLDPGHIGSNSWDLNWVFQLQSIRFSPLYHGLLQTGFEIRPSEGNGSKRFESLTLGLSWWFRGSESTFPEQETWIQSLGGELRSHLSQGNEAHALQVLSPHALEQMSCKERSGMPQ